MEEKILKGSSEELEICHLSSLGHALKKKVQDYISIWQEANIFIMFLMTLDISSNATKKLSPHAFFCHYSIKTLNNESETDQIFSSNYFYLK